MNDPFLLPYLPAIVWRNQYIKQQERVITDNGKISLYDVADYHLFFGLHPLSVNNHSLCSNISHSDVSASSSECNGWIFREWAPNATAVYITGVMTGWQIDERFRLFKKEYPSKNTQSGTESGFSRLNIDIWGRTFDKDTFKHGDLYRLRIFWNGGEGDRIPTCATRVVQDPQTLIFNAQVWHPEAEYQWKTEYELKNSNSSHRLSSDRLLLCSDLQQKPLFIYEAHAGMAQEEGRVGTFQEFEKNTLPRIKDAGYNAIQLMAVQEHPYYGSFGYHVSNFFAPSSRFGTPDDFKSLVDAAHLFGIKVIMDIVHSHAVSNEVEGLSRFDGTLTQFFHDGERGLHRLWGSRCFDYSKKMVVRFLLSNCRYWIEEYHVDGFRFDGITSMLYKDHGIERAFTCYADYFMDDGHSGDARDNTKQNSSSKLYNNGGVDLDALSYLYLANRLIHEIMPDAITIAEDVSGYPGLAAPQSSLVSSSSEISAVIEQVAVNQNPADTQEISGTGFDYRFAMGVPDFWIKLLKEYRDEDWPLGQLWYELNARRDDEKSISYAECHDQALVGDQTLMMRLMGEQIYSAMGINYETSATFRGVSLHKMIRLITLASAGNGYLNFMGNEFGHPEWIDFPGRHNNWSYHFSRRQWSLRDNKNLYFYMLAQFDKDMIELSKKYPFLGTGKAQLLHIHEYNKVIAFKREIQINLKYEDNQAVPDNNRNQNHKGINYGNLIFIFNFNSQTSFNDYMIDAPAGKYQEVMSSDDIKYGGKGRLVSGQVHFTHYKYNAISGNRNYLSLYLPTRTAIVLALSDDM